MKKLLLVLILFPLMLAGCNGEGNNAVEVAEEEWTFELILHSQEKIELAAEWLLEQETVEREVTPGEDDHRIYSGILLSTLLADYDLKQKELESIRCIAGDGYIVNIPDYIFQDREVLLALYRSGERLGSREYPVRVVIPEEELMYWVQNCVRLELEIRAQPPEQVSTVYILEALLRKINPPGQKVKVQDLVAHLGLDEVTLHFTAIDGLEKAEHFSDIKNTYISLEGPDAPYLGGEDLHAGRKVKELSHIQIGDNMLLAWSTWQNMDFATRQIEGQTGIALDELLLAAGLSLEGSLDLVAAEGFSREIEGLDTEKGILRQQDDGHFRVHFEHLSRMFHIREMVKIKLSD